MTQRVNAMHQILTQCVIFFVEPLDTTWSDMARVIKRYDNRKLYDTEASAYVSLSSIAALVRDGETVVVLDNVTGEDLTVQTLTQVILDEGRRGRGSLSSDLLHGILRRGEEVFESGVSTLRHGVDDLFQQSVRKVQSFLASPEADEVTQLRGQLARLEDLLERVLHTETKATNEGSGADEADAPKEPREGA